MCTVHYHRGGNAVEFPRLPLVWCYSFTRDLLDMINHVHSDGRVGGILRMLASFGHLSV